MYNVLGLNGSPRNLDTAWSSWLLGVSNLMN